MRYDRIMSYPISFFMRGYEIGSFGAERDFQVQHEASGVVTTVLHRDGHVLHLPFPMNIECWHSVPKRKRVAAIACLLSLAYSSSCKDWSHCRVWVVPS